MTEEKSGGVKRGEKRTAGRGRERKKNARELGYVHGTVTRNKEGNSRRWKRRRRRRRWRRRSDREIEREREKEKE